MNRQEAPNATEILQPRRKHRSIARSAKLIDRARDLRQTTTETEQTAWRLLRSLRSRGFKFRREVPIDQYIVDFYCPRQRLVVELDGSVHGQPSQAKRDLRRDAHLKKLGNAVARFPNGIVLEAPELFVDKVLRLVWSLPDAFLHES
jgi:very-short-patch-repair endonuclease